MAVFQSSEYASPVTAFGWRLLVHKIILLFTPASGEILFVLWVVSKVLWLKSQSTFC